MVLAYDGLRPYVFVSYSHKDGDAASPVIEGLADAGCRVWYDEGIGFGEEFPKRIAERISSCSCFLALLSSSYAEARWCGRELQYAFDVGATVLIARVDDVGIDALAPILGKRLSWQQLASRGDYASDEDFLEALVGSGKLDRCMRRSLARRVWLTVAVLFVAVTLISLKLVAPRVVDRPKTTPDTESGDAVDALSEQESGLQAYEWAELKSIADEIAAAGGYDEALEIAMSYGLTDEGGALRGDTKDVPLSDGTWAKVRIAGILHDELADGSGLAGLTFEFADVPTTRRMNPTAGNYGGWERSEMRAWLNREFFETLPEDLRSGIVAVKKRTNNRGYTNTDDGSVVSTTIDRVWLLSMTEIYGELSNRSKFDYLYRLYDEEGSQYKLYNDKGVTYEPMTVFLKDGPDGLNSLRWWLRSPDAYDEGIFHVVIIGLSGSGMHADVQCGVSPCFCL